MNLIIRIILAIFISMPTFAQLTIKGIAPEGLLLANLEELGLCQARIYGPHGLSGCCFGSNPYLTVMSNVVGEGYEIGKNVPDGLSSIDVKSNKFGNKLGVELGMSRADVIKKIGLDSRTKQDTIIWHSKKMIGEREYDVQTWLEMEFEELLLVRFGVFTTTTN